MSHIYYHYFKLILHRTDNSQTERVTIKITSENVTINADDMYKVFKTVLRKLEDTANTKFECLSYLWSEVYK